MMSNPKIKPPLVKSVFSCSLHLEKIAELALFYEKHNKIAKIL